MTTHQTHSAAERSFDDCIEALAPIRKELLAHPVYEIIRDEVALRTFMEHHVWAVWDFMSVLKSIQSRVTCVRTPWVPTGDPVMRRFINEIVLVEESDESSPGVMSHFELYRLAMSEMGARLGPIDDAIRLVADGTSSDEAFAASSGPVAALEFSRKTLSLTCAGSDAALFGVFTFSREELIPDLFRSVVSGMAGKGAQAGLLHEYLDRHIQVDGADHGPLARRMVESVCGDSRELWSEALTAAEDALRARIQLWDGALVAMRASPELESKRDTANNSGTQTIPLSY